MCVCARDRQFSEFWTFSFVVLILRNMCHDIQDLEHLYCATSQLHFLFLWTFPGTLVSDPGICNPFCHPFFFTFVTSFSRHHMAHALQAHNCFMKREQSTLRHWFCITIIQHLCALCPPPKRIMLTVSWATFLLHLAPSCHQSTLSCFLTCFFFFLESAEGYLKPLKPLAPLSQSIFQLWKLHTYFIAAAVVFIRCCIGHSGCGLRCV